MSISKCLSLTALCFLLPLAAAHANTRIQGVDPVDNDEYTLQLTGPGTISGSSLSNLLLSGTTSASTFTLNVTRTVGDGVVTVADLSTDGADLGSCRIKGNLGSLNIGNVGTLDVRNIGDPCFASTLNINGNITRLTAAGYVIYATINVSGNLNNLNIGTTADTGSKMISSHLTVGGNLTNATFARSLTAGSSLVVNGSVTNLTVKESLFDSDLTFNAGVSRLDIQGGVFNLSKITVAGSVTDFHVGKNFSDSFLTVNGKLTTARLDDDLVNSRFIINNADNITVREDIIGSRIRINYDLNRFRVDDTEALTLTVGGYLGNLHIQHNLVDSMLSILDGIDTAIISGDMVHSTVMAGVDIGPDFLRDPNDAVWGNVEIKNMFIYGDCFDSNIAAGVDSVAPAFEFGDGNDQPVADDVGTSRIKRLFIMGQVYSSQLPNDTYAITASDGIDQILVGGRTFTGVPGVARQEF